MSQNVINYLQENKDKFLKEELIISLRKAGYKESDISEGLKIVYGEAEANSAQPNIIKTIKFLDFKAKQIYQKKSEKILDFLFGFIGIIILKRAISVLVESIFSYNTQSAALSFSLLIFISFEMLLIIYLFKRRKFISYGLAVNLIISFFTGDYFDFVEYIL